MLVADLIGSNKTEASTLYIKNSRQSTITVQDIFFRFRIFGRLMLGHYVLAAVTLFIMFILFLVISRTMNNTINLLMKLEYLLQKEYDLKKETLEVRWIMEEQAKLQKEDDAG